MRVGGAQVTEEAGSEAVVRRSGCGRFVVKKVGKARAPAAATGHTVKGIDAIGGFLTEVRAEARDVGATGRRRRLGCRRRGGSSPSERHGRWVARSGWRKALCDPEHGLERRRGRGRMRRGARQTRQTARRCAWVAQSQGVGRRSEALPPIGYARGYARRQRGEWGREAPGRSARRRGADRALADEARRQAWRHRASRTGHRAAAGRRGGCAMRRGVDGRCALWISEPIGRRSLGSGREGLGGGDAGPRLGARRRRVGRRNRRRSRRRRRRRRGKFSRRRLRLAPPRRWSVRRRGVIVSGLAGEADGLQGRQRAGQRLAPPHREPTAPIRSL